MKKRLTRNTLVVVLVLGFTACGGNDSNGPTPVPTPTPPTQAEITFNLDPSPLVANYAGDGWYRFKVNLAFSESAGIGFTINNIRYTLTSSVTGLTLLNVREPINEHVAGNGRRVLQYTSPLYRTLAGGGAVCSFVASITDDRGNAINLTNQVNVSHRGGPRVEIPQ